MKLAVGLEASNVFTFSLSLTPVALSANIKAQEQAFSVPAGTLPANAGALAATDVVLMLPPSQNNSLCPAAYAFVDATGKVNIGFANLTAAANTPVAGTYGFVVIRP